MNMGIQQQSNILVVDDEPNNLTLLRRLLSDQGYKVRPAISGELALKAVGVAPPDLVLLDIMMPGGMDGYAVCGHLKANPLTRDIPVLFLSALDETEDKVRAFRSGGVDYITKPFQVDEVLARVNTHLMIRKSQQEIAERNRILEKLNSELRAALEEIHTLKGIIPICASCKKIRDDKGYWKQLETYIREHSLAEFSHGICPDCARLLYPDIDLDL